VQIGNVLTARLLNPEPGRYQNFLSRNPEAIGEVLSHFKDFGRKGADFFFIFSWQTAGLQWSLSFVFVIAGIGRCGLGRIM
jgi:hypothetical protein